MLSRLYLENSLFCVCVVFLCYCYFWVFLVQCTLADTFCANSCEGSLRWVAISPWLCDTNTRAHNSPEPSSAKMKLVYKLSSINQARDALCTLQRTVKYRSYTTGERLNHLQCFDALVEEENVPQNVASTTLDISLSCVLEWRSKKEALSQCVLGR